MTQRKEAALATVTDCRSVRPRELTWSAFLFNLLAAVFVAIGSLKARWSVRPAWLSGLETLVVGATASGLAWAIGRALADTWT